jgi:endonuclease G, mitochondrial
VRQEDKPLFATQQVKAAERRYDERAEIRTATKARIATAGRVAANSRERVERRKRRIAAAPPTTPAAAREILQAPQAESDALLERILGSDDTFNVNYLALAARAASSVGRIRIRRASGRAAGFGTGFLVSDRLMLTNNHVLPELRTAATSLVDFDYEDDVDGQAKSLHTFAFAPGSLYVTDEDLDFTLVAVASTSQSGYPLSRFAWSPLVEQEGKVLLGELVNIIQHPRGDRKRLALRQNEVVDLLPLFVHYETDTSPGSSGSPLFNEQWEVVGLHHAGVPRRDGNTILARGGVPWTKDMGDEAIDWVANEGVRASRVVAHLRDVPLAGEAADLRDALLTGTNQPSVEALTSAGATAEVGTTAAPVVQLPGVEISIRLLGAASAGTQTGPLRGSPVRLASRPSEPPDLAAALAEAATARTIPYYDNEADTAARNAYYSRLEVGADRAANTRALTELLTSTHAVALRYRPGKHVYPWVDLQPNRRLRSVYSAREFEPEDLIREDFEIERLEIEFAERLAANSALGPDAVDAFLERAAPFNCEHVVPQSWFGKREPMRGDLHHLFTCEWNCNSFRGNARYHDFVDFREKDLDECGRLIGFDFEPSAGKGAVARATMYFIVRYPGEIGDLPIELQHDAIETLLSWHERFPVDEWERHRNAAIQAKQGNRNPFIDTPEVARRVDLALAFAAGG